MIGENRKAYDPDKTKTMDYYYLTLAAIAKEIEMKYPGRMEPSGLRTSDRVLWETEGCLQDLSQPEEGGALLVFREGLSHQDQKGGHLSARICGDSPPDRIL